MEYTQEELKRLQQVSLEMAEYLVGFCRSHGLLCASVWQSLGLRTMTIMPL